MKLLESWTFSEPLPEPVKTLAEEEGRKTKTYLERCSAYNDMRRTKKATLHGPTLRGIGKFLEVWEQEKGAAGLVCDTEGKILYYCMEYDHPAGRCAFLYNPANGGFFQRQKNTGEKSISRQIGPDGTDGNFCMMMLAFASYVEGRIQDREFLIELERYRKCKDTDGAQCIEAAYILCDNFYRRLVRRLVPCSSEVAENGEIGSLEEEDFGMYAPDVVLKGQFQLFQRGKGKRRAGKCTVGEAMEKYHWGKELEEEEKGKIPDIPEDYVVSANAENILRKITKTGMRNFMLRGEAGTGKTTTVQIIAKCLGLPYYYFCCGEGTEESDLISSYMPNTGKKAAETGIKADWKAFMMDPAGVLMELTGNYEEGLGMQEGFEKLLGEAYRAGKREAEIQKDFVMVESELVQGCRRPSVIEIQEPTVVGRAGVLVKLNRLLDDCAAVTLADGEVVRRNPDTIIIMTTNTAYNGCRPMNQSVLSRLNLLIDEESLTEKEMAERAGIRTGCKDKSGLVKMAKLLNGLKKNYADVIAAGGICGYREYEDWVRAWMESGDLDGELKSTVISKMTDQADIQTEILASARMIMKFSVA